RWEAFGVSSVLIAAAAAGVALAWLYGVRQPILLLVVPLIYLNPRQYESLIGPANIAHGAMPVLLLTLCCLCFFLRASAMRLALLALLTAASIFTGFALFIGLIIPIVLTVDWV